MSREVMQMALYALEKHVHEYETMEALRTALAQPKKEWVGLTDAEIKACAKGGRSIGISFHDAICRAEAKLKEKNT